MKATAAPQPKAVPAATPVESSVVADPYLWLEEVDSDRAMKWVKQEDARTLQALATGPAFDPLRDRIAEVMDSKEKLPMVSRRGRYLYNFWTDADHPRGLWRRTTLGEYRKPNPSWQLLLDVDALGKQERVSWVWHGADCLEPDYRRCLVHLSRGGADAQVVREFDLATRTFVKGGFELPEAKSNVGWKDANTLYVATDFGPGTMTRSSYPRIVKEWKRGTPLSDATLVYEGKPEDMMVSAVHDFTPGFSRDLVTRVIDFWNSETFLRRPDGSLQKIDAPLDAMVDAQHK